jgi:predicted  nucleic acid-binding Zn-ribbon protein
MEYRDIVNIRDEYAFSNIPPTLAQLDDIIKELNSKRAGSNWVQEEVQDLENQCYDLENAIDEAKEQIRNIINNLEDAIY